MIINAPPMIVTIDGFTFTSPKMPVVRYLDPMHTLRG
jgi:hypothetical protein